MKKLLFYYFLLINLATGNLCIAMEEEEKEIFYPAGFRKHSEEFQKFPELPLELGNYIVNLATEDELNRLTTESHIPSVTNNLFYALLPAYIECPGDSPCYVLSPKERTDYLCKIDNKLIGILYKHFSISPYLAIKLSYDETDQETVQKLYNGLDKGTVLQILSKQPQERSSLPRTIYTLLVSQIFPKQFPVDDALQNIFSNRTTAAYQQHLEGSIGYMIEKNNLRPELHYFDTCTPCVGLDFLNKNIRHLNGLQTICQTICKKINIMHITDLMFSHNQLTKIPSHIFDSFSRLRFLDLGNNKIEEIEPEAFKGISHLQELYLGANCLREIKAGYFNGLLNLNGLDLSCNQLTTIKNGAFDNLHVSRLCLNKNNLGQLTENDLTVFIHELQKLKELHWLELKENNFGQQAQDQIKKALLPDVIIFFNEYPE